MIYFISDPHFDHTNIIEYCGRPFDTVEQMNDLIYTNWITTIKQDDIVYFLGDMSFGRNSRSAKWWLKHLTGRIVYIKGSHDKGIKGLSGLPDNVIEVTHAKIIKAKKTRFLLTHSPYLKDYYNHINMDERYDWHIHGHVHNIKPLICRKTKKINVSVETTNYCPISMDEILNMV